MQAALRDWGWIVNHKKIKRLLREHDMHPPRRRRFVTTTDSDPDAPVFPDHSKDCELNGPYRLWVADLTYMGDRLEGSLATADTTRARFLEALLHEALSPGAEREAAA